MLIEFMQRGGVIMWPLLATSVVALSVVIDRLVFSVRGWMERRPDVVEQIFTKVEHGEVEDAIRVGHGSEDFVARTLVYGLQHREQSFANALLHAANTELKRFNQGLPVLDTIVTLAPLLGLLGTVTGMIRAFGLLGGKELEAPAVITGGIAEALLATAFGLTIAIMALIPLNYLNARLEEARHELEDASTRLELLLIGSSTPS